MMKGDFSGSRRRALRELHTLPHRDGYRRQDELDSKVIFSGISSGKNCASKSCKITWITFVDHLNHFSVIPTQCTYSGVSAAGSPAIKDDIARRFLDFLMKLM